jgi:hypothetical protein
VPLGAPEAASTVYEILEIPSIASPSGFVRLDADDVDDEEFLNW